jgi:L-asparaginase
MSTQKSVLLIFTGGTISMAEDQQTGALKPLEFNRVREFIPELKLLDIHIESVAFNPLIDSSDVQPHHWVRIAEIIEQKYEKHDGFVILHGTDTMAYSASALSFMLENLSKPVIFTGAQLPIGMLRTDAKENLLTAIEIAANSDENGVATVHEVCIYFEDSLFRGNRTTKKNAELFNAFASYNYPALVKVGVHFNFSSAHIRQNRQHTPLKVNKQLDTNILILKLFPGITPHIIHSLLHAEGLRAVVLESYGAGNASRQDWFYDALAEAVDRDIIIVNITQCNVGSVQMGLYETSLNLQKAGVISGFDLTTEAAVTKLMFLLGEKKSTDIIKTKMQLPLCGEMSCNM